MELNIPRPQPFDMTNDFARHTMAKRVPDIIRSVQAANADYPPAILNALDRLHDGLIGNEPIPMLSPHPVPMPDYDDWAAAYQARREKTQPLTWLHGEWFFAETFVYRYLMQVIRWFETGRDPFAFSKQAELAGDRPWQLLNAALAVEGDFNERLFTLLGFALWGNRVDLSHPSGTLTVQSDQEDELLVDDREKVVAYLASAAAAKCGVVHLIADNAGTELAIDLVLIDLLLRDADQEVVLHVKGHPTFVSDTTLADVWSTFNAMEAYGGAPAALAHRLRQAWQCGQFKLAGYPFWNSSRFLWEMPASLRQIFAEARLVIVKGDVNYRRLIGDALWPDGIPFADALRYFPAPLLALRSLKCDALVGVPAEKSRKLNVLDKAWRTTGRYGVMQFAPGGSNI